MGEIVSIWIKREKGGPMERVDAAQLVAGRGLAGSADQGGSRQITLIEERAWRDAEREVGSEVDPSVRRANVMVRGVDLEHSAGHQLRLGGCVIVIGGENPACDDVDAVRPGLADALHPHWRAGVFGEISTGGTIRAGDPVEWHSIGRR